MRISIDDLPRFPKNLDKFKLTERYWNDFFDEIISSSDSNDKWVNWFNKATKQDGSPYLDDGYYSMLSKINFDKKKGFEITQFENLNDNKLGVWFDQFGQPSSKIDRFVINTTLTQANINLIRTLLEAYILEDKSIEKMQELIDDIRERE